MFVQLLISISRYLEELIARHRANLDLDYLRSSAKEFIHVERSDIIERLEEFLRNP